MEGLFSVEISVLSEKGTRAIREDSLIEKGAQVSLTGEMGQLQTPKRPQAEGDPQEDPIKGYGQVLVCLLCGQEGAERVRETN